MRREVVLLIRRDRGPAITSLVARPSECRSRSFVVKTRTGTEEVLRCSFCHKSQDAVAKLISSPSDYPRAYICDECVAVCNSILEDDRTRRSVRRPESTAQAA